MPLSTKLAPLCWMISPICSAVARGYRVSVHINTSEVGAVPRSQRVAARHGRADGKNDIARLDRIGQILNVNEAGLLSLFLESPCC
jgi:hypothetical protein